MFSKENISNFLSNFCSVCFENISQSFTKHSLEEDMKKIIQCSKCKIKIHLRCFGISNENNKNFICDVCKSKNKNISCEICNLKFGFMKEFYDNNNNKKFVHIFCSLFNEKKLFLFKNLSEMNFISLENENLNKNNNKKKCEICSNKNGFFFKCSNKECEKNYHLFCLYFQMIFQENSDENFLPSIEFNLTKKISIFCPNHKKEITYCLCNNGENGEEMICCDYCDTWFHINCIGISLEEFLKIKKKNWFCKYCKKYFEYFNNKNENYFKIFLSNYKISDVIFIIRNCVNNIIKFCDEIVSIENVNDGINFLNEINVGIFYFQKLNKKKNNFECLITNFKEKNEENVNLNEIYSCSEINENFYNKINEICNNNNNNKNIIEKFNEIGILYEKKNFNFNNNNNNNNEIKLIFECVEIILNKNKNKKNIHELKEIDKKIKQKLNNNNNNNNFSLINISLKKIFDSYYNFINETKSLGIQYEKQKNQYQKFKKEIENNLQKEKNKLNLLKEKYNRCLKSKISFELFNNIITNTMKINIDVSNEINRFKKLLIPTNEILTKIEKKNLNLKSSNEILISIQDDLIITTNEINNFVKNYFFTKNWLQQAKENLKENEINNIKNSIKSSEEIIFFNNDENIINIINQLKNKINNIENIINQIENIINNEEDLNKLENFLKLIKENNIKNEKIKLIENKKNFIKNFEKNFFSQKNNKNILNEFKNTILNYKINKFNNYINIIDNKINLINDINNEINEHLFIGDKIFNVDSKSNEILNKIKENNIECENEIYLNDYLFLINNSNDFNNKKTNEILNNQKYLNLPSNCLFEKN